MYLRVRCCFAQNSGTSKSSNVDANRCVGIDLSASSKSGGTADSASSLDEVQDFSMPTSKSRHHSQFSQPSAAAISNAFYPQVQSAKSKLDGMLNKLVEKKNVSLDAILCCD